jgi:hypothetical protein
VRRPAYRVHRPPLFFPYALLFFTLFNIMNVAFALSAIGANLVWPVALYSSQALLGPGFGGRNFYCFRRSQHRDAWIHTSSTFEDPSTPRLSLENAFRRRSIAEAGLVF